MEYYKRREYFELPLTNIVAARWITTDPKIYVIYPAGNQVSGVFVRHASREVNGSKAPCTLSPDKSKLGGLIVPTGARAKRVFSNRSVRSVGRLQMQEAHRNREQVPMASGSRSPRTHTVTEFYSNLEQILPASYTCYYRLQWEDETLKH